MSMFRIDGLASGMDTYEMVQDLMKAHRKPVDKMLQQRQVLEWQREEYRAINTLLLNFRTNTVSSLRLDAGFAAVSAGSSNPAAATATAATGAANTSYQLDVTQLATNAYRTSAVISGDGGKIDADAAILSQWENFNGADFDWHDNRTKTLQGGTNKYTLEIPGGDTLTGVQHVAVQGHQYEIYEDETAFQGARDQGKTNIVLLDKETGTLTFAEPVAAEDEIFVNYDVRTTKPGENPYFSFNITTHDHNGQAVTREFTVHATMSLNQLLAQISNDKELGLTAFYDAGADRISLSTTRTGQNSPHGNEIQIEGFLESAFRVDENNKEGAVYGGGQNAVVTVNGMEIQRPANDFTLSGVHFSLKAAGETATITVGRDTDAIFDQIKNFISEYNGLLDILNGKLNEERFPDYPPLLDDGDHKQELTDRQIDQWQEKARSGLLRHDSMLSGIVTRLRNEMFSRVDGLDDSLNHLAQIGISIGSRADNGKLVIDESKLRQAIEQDPDGVAKIFNKRGNTTAEQGIAQRLYGSLDQAIKQVTARAGSLSSPTTNDQSWIGRQITDLDKRMDRAETRMQKLEDKYWRQFAAMERALNQMNAQSMWLAQQMGGGMM